MVDLFFNKQTTYQPNPNPSPNPNQTRTSSTSVDDPYRRGAILKIKVKSDEEFNHILNQQILNRLGKRKLEASVDAVLLREHEPLWTLDTEFCQECNNQEESTLGRPTRRPSSMPSSPPTTQPLVPIRFVPIVAMLLPFTHPLPPRASLSPKCSTVAVLSERHLWPPSTPQKARGPFWASLVTSSYTTITLCCCGTIEPHFHSS